jgi:hypothetical protein
LSVQALHWRRQVWRRWAAPTTSSSSCSRQRGVQDSDADASSSCSAGWGRGLEAAARRYERPPPDTFRRLRHVLETYTDVTRYPWCVECCG